MKLFLTSVLLFLPVLQSYACETAFAVCPDATCFLDEPLASRVPSNRWGWSNRVEDGSSPLICDLYVGAAQCDLSKGKLVGTVAVQDEMVVYSLHPGAHLQLHKAHVYLGAQSLPRDSQGRRTVAPGQYPFQADFDATLGGVVKTSANLETGLHFIGHASLCEIASTSPSISPSKTPASTSSKAPSMSPFISPVSTPSNRPSLRPSATSFNPPSVLDDPDTLEPTPVPSESQTTIPPTPVPTIPPPTQFPFLIPPPTPQSPPPTNENYVCNGESAFLRCGFATRCFDERFSGNQRWGWSNGMVFTEQCKLYAGAANCDLSKASLVGYVLVDLFNEAFEITMDDEWTLTELHVHVGAEEFPKGPQGQDMISPGLYPFQYDFDEPGVYQATLSLGKIMSESQFLIMHAKVCRVD